MVDYFSDFRRFARLETCFFITGIALSGYLLFNTPGAAAAPVAATVLLLTAANYSYNHITDMKEDRINNSLQQNIASGRKGKALVLFFFSGSFVSSVFLGTISFLIYVSCVAGGVLYSFSRMKRFILLKNLYTGFFISLVFLLGSSAGGSLSPDMLGYVPFIFLFGFTLNLLGDIRGVEGDRLAGVRTIPVAFGEKAARTGIYSLCIVFLSLLIMSQLTVLFPLAVFMLLISLFTWMRNHYMARVSILSSFISFPFWLMLMKLGGGL